MVPIGLAIRLEEKLLVDSSSGNRSRTLNEMAGTSLDNKPSRSVYEKFSESPFIACVGRVQDRTVAQRAYEDLTQHRRRSPAELDRGIRHDWEQQPLSNGPIKSALSAGAFDRRTSRAGFEVIAARSVIDLRRGDGSDVPTAKWSGMRENQRIVFMSNGGENVRRWNSIWIRPVNI